MLIQSLKTHFPARAPEWLNSLALVTWGSYVVLHPQVFYQPATRDILSGMTQIVSWMPYNPAAIWGLSAFLVGFIRAAALFINGAYIRTPAVRVCMSAASAFIWTQVIIGMLLPGIAQMGLAIYPVLVLADICSAYRAGKDVITAEATRRMKELEAATRVVPIAVPRAS